MPLYRAFFIRDREAELECQLHCGIRYKCPVPLFAVGSRGIAICWPTVRWLLGLGPSPSGVPRGAGPFLQSQFPTLARYCA